ncbi:unnamed protein product, partial [marine sediment metagenome]
WICGNDAVGGGGGTSIWVDAGTYIYPNSTYASNIVVFGYIYADDWSNVTITESQITDLSHTVDTTIGNETSRFNTLVGTDCSAGDFMDGVDGDGTPSCETPAGGGGVNASQIKNELGFFVNITAVQHNGSWVTGDLTGYEAGNDLCNNEFSGSHIRYSNIQTN